MSRPGITNVLTARLAEFIDPFRILGIQHRVRKAHPVPKYCEPEKRNSAYHHGRIQQLYREVQNGSDWDPIVLDCDCWNGRVRPVPVLIDGHHRLAAAILGRKQKIAVSFSGRVDLLRYLQGRRKSRPEE